MTVCIPANHWLTVPQGRRMLISTVRIFLQRGVGPVVFEHPEHPGELIRVERPTDVRPRARVEPSLPDSYDVNFCPA